jgi:three-Cys-motif partner protein
MTRKVGLDLKEMVNANCLRCDNDKRNQLIKEELCSHLVSAIDGLPVRCVGDWAYEKIFRLVQYFGIFTAGMKNKWNGLNYVEICSGPGRCIMRGSGNEIDGTALAIIRHPIFSLLNKALFIDNEEKVINVLNQRIKGLNAQGKAEAVIGSYNDIPGIQEILARLPSGCLNLCFIDPTHCDVPFSMIEAIRKQLVNVDFIINVAIGTDFTRNVVSAATNPTYKVREKYEAFLGSSDFFQRADVQEQARLQKHAELRRLFMAEYQRRFQEMNYLYTDQKPVEHYYYLVFTSSHPRGLEFWNSACKIGPDKQRQLL